MESTRTGIAEQRGLHVARRSYPNQSGSDSATSFVANPQSGAGPMRAAVAEGGQDACPIWFAALRASSCLAKANGENHAIRWESVSGRAIYTNHGGDAERIEPLGVSLNRGQTLAVYWRPGETAYTLEVYQNEKCA